MGKAPYLFAGAFRALDVGEMKTGDRRSFEIFDPATMGRATVTVEVLGREDIEIMGEQRLSTKVSLDFKGATQTAWIGENGEVLREKGLLGIRLEKTTREAALAETSTEPSQDFTLLASVKSNAIFDDPGRLSRLKVQIGGVDLTGLRLHGGRQTLENDILTIIKEKLDETARDVDAGALGGGLAAHLKATAFIQSDHPEIRGLVREIVAVDDSPARKAEKLMEWIHGNIEKKPALSMPDALSTLENRVGDCNEHAVLLAAMARAAGVPAKIEAGLAYLKGRFFYHAWNSLYLGKWVTADSVFGQLPADVTHIRFSTGGTGQQLDLVGLIGRVRLNVLEFEDNHD
ncbi:MAG: transglutaminase domain-containing protein [Desulfobacterales bacterium]|nr:transglutaminase domain-containing protein [Desulfobacterales bacterium]